MKRKKLLDSFAMLSYLNREAGFQKVRDIMADSQKSEDPVFMNEVNIGEVYYILFRKRGREKAEYFLERVLPSLPLNPIPNGFDDVIEAARVRDLRHSRRLVVCEPLKAVVNLGPPQRWQLPA